VKRIYKNEEPATLKKYRETTKAEPKNYYKAFKREPQNYSDLVSSLLKEQGCLCAYTLLEISNEDGASKASVDHFLPKKYTDKQLDYKNMFACYKDSKIPFGEAVKGDVELSVSPLDEACETAFKYENSGYVIHTNNLAEQVISTLNLNHDYLIQQRLAALKGYGLTYEDEEPLTKDQAKIIANKINIKGNDGKYIPLCHVIYQVASQF
jgi:uncharacterized protein (TIGR02646 family)